MPRKRTLQPWMCAVLILGWSSGSVLLGQGWQGPAKPSTKSPPRRTATVAEKPATAGSLPSPQPLTAPQPVTSFAKPLTPPGVALPSDPEQLSALTAASNRIGHGRSGTLGSHRSGAGHDAAGEQLGEKWAADLKRGDSSNEQLVALIQEKLLAAPPQARNSFRQGFITAYGTDGSSVFAQALSQAKSRSSQSPR